MDRDNSFWQFSLDLYARPGITEICLALQDECAVDVNLLLFSAWLAASGRALSSGEFSALQVYVEAWRGGVVKHIRLARISVKNSPHQAYYAELKRCELHAEQIQQAMMYDFFRGHEHRLVEIHDNHPHPMFLDSLPEHVRDKAGELLVEFGNLAGIASLRQ